jgi:hypothetical protein
MDVVWVPDDEVSLRVKEFSLVIDFFGALSLGLAML